MGLYIWVIRWDPNAYIQTIIILSMKTYCEHCEKKTEKGKDGIDKCPKCGQYNGEDCMSYW